MASGAELESVVMASGIAQAVDDHVPAEGDPSRTPVSECPLFVVHTLTGL